MESIRVETRVCMSERLGAAEMFGTGTRVC